MDRPEKQPSRDVFEAYKIGTISSIIFNKDATAESHAEAESRSYGGSFDYEVMVDLVGKDGICTIGEDTLKLIALMPSPDSYGCWMLHRDSRILCETWEKWLKAEERDLKTFRRLQKKFRGV
jgi:hypothetical protein